MIEREIADFATAAESYLRKRGTIFESVRADFYSVSERRFRKNRREFVCIDICLLALELAGGHISAAL